MNIELANTIPLAEILDKLGVKPAKKSKAELYYLSPLRNEKTPSFHVNTVKNVWYDFGTGEGGDVVSFVCRHLQNSGVGYAVPDALRWIKNMMGYATFIAPVKNFTPPETEKKLSVKNEKDIEHPSLIQYLESRGFPLSVAQKYLREITVYNKETKTSIFALGFKNDKGGFELRNKFYQGSTKPKYITFIRGNTPKPPGIHIFEGWPDYLSAIIHKCDGRKFEDDAIVLNSLSNLKKATPYIKGYGYSNLYSWMDNDKAGKAATVSIADFCKTEEELLHKPMNKIYAPYKDVNAWYMVKIGLEPG